MKLGQQPQALSEIRQEPANDRPDRANIVADIYSLARDDRAMEDLMSRINIEASVISVKRPNSRLKRS